MSAKHRTTSSMIIAIRPKRRSDVMFGVEVLPRFISDGFCRGRCCGVGAGIINIVIVVVPIFNLVSDDIIVIISSAWSSCRGG